MRLSILIPTTPDRQKFMESLFKQFAKQLGPFDSHVEREESDGFWGMYIHRTAQVEVIVFEDDKTHSIGYKRNALMSRAVGQYIAFIDSDDRIGENYFKRIFEGIEKGADCCSLKGIITEDGNNPLIFEHSIRYDCYKTNPDHMPVRYERFPNHLNSTKSSIAKQFKFPDQNHGEDTDWAVQMDNSGLIKTEHYIDEIIYHYDWMKK